MTIDIKSITEQIETLKAEFSEDLIWGVRFDNAGLEVGHIFDASREWADGELTGETLKGTCVLQDSHLHLIRNGSDYPGTPYIVCGYFVSYGEDTGEVVLSECEIMAVLSV